jgi:glycosyltransferase involved in cell wall biosynthesis
MDGRHPTGVDRVSLAYVRYFAEEARAMVRFRGKCLVLRPEPSRRMFSLILEPPDAFGWNVKNLVGQAYLSLRWDQDTRDAFLLNTGHSGPEQTLYLNRLKRMGLKPLFMVHDLIPIAHPEYCRPGEAEKHAVRIGNVLRCAHGIVTNSRHTIEELRRHARKVHLPMPPAEVSLLASPELPPPAPVPPIRPPYFVTIGTIEPRKNHWLLLQLWRKLVERHGPDAPRLVVIGQRGWECENVVDLLERCERLRGFVTELPNCSDAELSTYLHHAQALLFPSFAEGYGLPLIEALTLGVPAIVSNLPVFREVAGSIPEFLDPLDGLGWMRTIQNYSVPKSVARAAQLDRMQSFVPPTWQTHFKVIERFMECLD